MDILGIEITETATKWTAIAGVLTSIGTTIKMFITMRDNKRLKNSEIRKAKIENVDLVNNFYNEIFDHAGVLLKYQRDHFSYYVEYCNKNIEDFMQFISNKKPKENEDREETNS